MENTFTNLLLNHRLVYMTPGPEAPQPEAPKEQVTPKTETTETPEAKRTRIQNEEFDKLVLEAPGKTKEQLGDKFGEYKDAKKEEGGNKVQEVKMHGVEIQKLTEVLMGKGTQKEKNAAVDKYLMDWDKKKTKVEEITFKEADVIVGKPLKMQEKASPLDQKFAKLEREARDKDNPFLREALAKYKAERVQEASKPEKEQPSEVAMAEPGKKGEKGGVISLKEVHIEGKPAELSPQAQKVLDKITAKLGKGKEQPSELASREASPGEKARKAGEEVQKAYEPGKTEGTEAVLKFTKEQEREFGALAMNFYTKLDAGNNVDRALANAGEKITTNDLNKAIGKLRNNVSFDKAEDFIKKESRSAEALAIQASQAKTPQEYKRVADSTKAMFNRINNFKG